MATGATTSMTLSSMPNHPAAPNDHTSPMATVSSGNSAPRRVRKFRYSIARMTSADTAVSSPNSRLMVVLSSTFRSATPVRWTSPGHGSRVRRIPCTTSPGSVRSSTRMTIVADRPSSLTSMPPRYR